MDQLPIDGHRSVLEVAPTPSRRYRSPLVPARLIRLFAVAGAAAAAVSAAYLRSAGTLLDRLRADPLSVVQDDFLSMASSSDRIALFLVLIHLAMVVMLIVWLRRSYRNLASFGLRETRFRYGWVFWCWFTPIFNLFRPKQLVDEVWRASDPELPEAYYTPNASVPRLHNFWWAAWVVSTVGGFSAVRSVSPRSLAGMSVFLDVAFFGAVASAIALVLVERVIAGVTMRHHARARRLGLDDANASWVVSPRVDGRLSAARVGVVALPLVVAMSAYLVGGAAVGVASSGATGLSSQGESVTAAELSVGDCIDFPVGSFVVAVPRVPCSEPHDAEFIGPATLGAAADPYPGDNEVISLTAERCLEKFEPWVGIDYEESALDIALIYPTGDHWRAGGRTAQCFIVAFDGSKLTGTTRDSGL